MTLTMKPASAEYLLYQGKRAFYHGGVAGLRPGQWILPPTVTSQFASEAYAKFEAGEYWPDHVYLTTTVDAAKQYAALGVPERRGRGGDVYKVRPALLLSLDPACATEGLSWCAPAAQIISIVATAVRRGPYEAALIAQTKDQQQEPSRWNRRFQIPS